MSDDEHRIVGAAREALLLAKDAQIARLTAERDAALALTAAAYEAAAQVAADWGNGFAQKNNHYGAAATRVAAIIRRMLPADALAAQAARDERMRAEGRAEAEARGRLRGIEEAADKFRDCWDDPEAEDDGFAHNTEVAIRALGERGRLCRQPDDIKTR